MLTAPSGTKNRELRATDRIEVVRTAVSDARGRGLRIGCVPTMGALHAGHLSLITAAREETDFVVVTIFVNPTQFGPNEDFRQYPRTLNEDIEACRQAGVDLVFHPETGTIYGQDDRTFVEVAGLSDILEGEFRPGHFRGVATVVTKLLNITSPDCAYFGAKDYQQQLLIRRMCRELHLPVEVCTKPTVREPDGLALSSRNRYLSDSERQVALLISQSLQLAKQLVSDGEHDIDSISNKMLHHLTSSPSVSVDYATIRNAETLEELSSACHSMVGLIAARVGKTRLIDNMLIDLPEPR